jgi:hypothetical protein
MSLPDATVQHGFEVFFLRWLVHLAFACGAGRGPHCTKLPKELEMKAYPHHPTHWLAVAIVIGVGLIAFEAFGQQAPYGISENASAVFQGRPAMAGAQAGLGAMAGLPQGGIGLQGSDGAEINLRRPRVVDQQTNPLPAVACNDVPRISALEPALCLPQVRNERLERRLALLGIDPQQRGRM